MKTDYYKLEENLIKTEMTIRDMIKEEETLSKIDNILNNCSIKTSEKISATIKTPENLGKGSKLTLPLKITGKMLGVGRHRKRYYTKTQLMKAVSQYAGTTFPLKLDHLRDKAGAVIGLVDSIYWDDVEKAIRYKAHVNDETHARNIVDNAHTDVSASIFSLPKFDEQYGLIGTDLEFAELSIVVDGAYEGNTLEVAK